MLTNFGFGKTNNNKNDRGSVRSSVRSNSNRSTVGGFSVGSENSINSTNSKLDKHIKEDGSRGPTPTIEKVSNFAKGILPKLAVSNNKVTPNEATNETANAEFTFHAPKKDEATPQTSYHPVESVCEGDVEQGQQNNSKGNEVQSSPQGSLPDIGGEDGMCDGIMNGETANEDGEEIEDPEGEGDDTIQDFVPESVKQLAELLSEFNPSFKSGHDNILKRSFVMSRDDHEVESSNHQEIDVADV